MKRMVFLFLLSVSFLGAGCASGIGADLPENLLYMTLLKDRNTDVTGSVSDGFLVSAPVAGEDLRTAFTTSTSVDLTVQGAELAQLSFDGSSLGYGEPYSIPGLTASMSPTYHTIDVIASSTWVRRSHVLNIKAMSSEAYGKSFNAGFPDMFGTSVAIDGEVLVVGAPGERSCSTGVNSGGQADNACTLAGAVYVFRRTNTTWVQEAYLKASNTNAGDRFGEVVSISGDTIVVAAINESSCASGVKSGGDGTGVEADNACFDGFYGTGAVYVFVRKNGTWSQEAYIKASNTSVATVRNFGWGLSVHGDRLAVGTPLERSCAQGIKPGGDGTGVEVGTACSEAGAVYVFARTGSTWTQEAYIKGSNTEGPDHFGESVSLHGDTLAVGATYEFSNATGINGSQLNNAANYSGAAYVFRRTGTLWAQEAYVKASNTGSEDNFGVSVSLAGDTLAVGARYEASCFIGIKIGGDGTGVETDNGCSGVSEQGAGATYVFTRSGSTWSQQAYIKASNTPSGGTEDDRFGSLVALSRNGDVLAVLAPDERSCGRNLKPKGDNTGIEADDSCALAGAAYIFARRGSTWNQQAYVKATNTTVAQSGLKGLAVGADSLVLGDPTEYSCATGVKAGGDGTGVELNTGCASAGAFYVYR